MTRQLRKQQMITDMTTLLERMIMLTMIINTHHQPKHSMVMRQNQSVTMQHQKNPLLTANRTAMKKANMITSTDLNSIVRTLSLLCLLATASYSYAGAGHAHGEARHDEHAQDDHSDEPALVYTHYTDVTELFVEFPPLVVNQPSTFIAHFTRMDNFTPLTSGTLDVHLKRDAKTVARFRVRQPARSGIFMPSVTAKESGDYQLSLEIRDGDLHAVHELGMVTVFDNRDRIRIDQAQAAGEINYLKEQQWENPFAISRAELQSLRPSVPGFATVIAPADGYAVVRAPSDGYFSTQSLLTAGDKVTESQLLGSLVPRLGEGADIGNLLVSQEKARAQYQLAQQDATRLQGLFEQGAIPEKRLQQAQQALEVARVELNTARSRLQQRSGKNGQAGIALTAPLAGELVDVSVRPGSFVRAGDALFTITSADRRWLDIQLPEKFAQQINKISGVWMDDHGTPLVLDASSGAQVVKISQQIDPLTRTASAAIEYPAKLTDKLLGSRFAVQAYIDSAKELLAVPASAIIDDGGQAVVYVQTAGETFARRKVQLGIQDGNQVQIIRGIEAGEWVVSRGAYYVKLASIGGDDIGHGHAH